MKLLGIKKLFHNNVNAHYQNKITESRLKFIVLNFFR